MSVRQAAVYCGVVERTIRGWRRWCRWLGRPLRSWPVTKVGSNEPVECSVADLDEVNAKRRGDLPIGKSEGLLTAAEAEDELQIPKRLVRQWVRRGCPALNWPPPKPPKRWGCGPVPVERDGKTLKLKPACVGSRAFGTHITGAALFRRDVLQRIKAAYAPPDRAAAGYWPTAEEAFEIYGVRIDEKSWTGGCVWLGGKSLRWRNGRRPRAKGWTLYRVVEYNPMQLRAIADAQAEAEKAATCDPNYLTARELAKRFGRSKRRIEAWCERKWSVLSGRKPRRKEGIHTPGWRGKFPPPRFHLDDVAAVAEWIEGTEPLPDGQTTIEASAQQHGIPGGTVRKRVNEHAPGSGKPGKRRYRNATRKTTFYPIEVLDAAIRGETVPVKAPGQSQSPPPASTSTMQTVARETKPEDVPSSLDPKVFYAPSEIAKHLDRSANSMSVTLSRLRKKLRDSDFREIANAGPRTAKFVYRWGAVEPHLRRDGS